MENAQQTLDRLTEAFSTLAECAAIAIAGSRTSQINDSLSDWDIYIYMDGHIDAGERERILSGISDSHMVNSSFFEEGDEFISCGVYFDLMYRDRSFIDEQIDRVWVHHQPSLGYTTCFLHNLKTSRFLYDRDGISKRIKELDGEYSDDLSRSIIDYNLRMIRGKSEGSWMKQLSSAVKRGDYVSRNHRLAALMASYFDCILAYNKVFHPGEKKLVGYCHLLCKRLPEAFDEDLERIYSRAYEGDLISAVEVAIEHLEELVRHI